MKGKNEQELIIKSNFYEIPLKELKVDIVKSKEKQEKIIYLLKNHNKLRSNEDFNEIKKRLQEAIWKGDLELIEIVLSESYEDNSLGMTFKINKTSKTASLFKVNKLIDHLIVPYSIKIEADIYLITSISWLGGELLMSEKNKKTIKTIQTISFEENSAVKTIYGRALQFSNIEIINIPSGLIELKDECFLSMDKLREIIVDSNNKSFIFQNECLFGKTDNNSEIFDKILFAGCDIKQVNIPSCIKIISPYAFESCRKLTKVEFEPYSKLQIIERSAFQYSKIQYISIPSSVSKICDSAFFICNSLMKVEFEPNSNLQIIERSAFEITGIKDFFIPPCLSKMEKRWCMDSYNLNKIIISPKNNNFIFMDGKYLIGKTDNNSNNYDKLLFVSQDIKHAIIPSNVKIINSYVFHSLKKLAKIEFEANSNLQKIKKCSFDYTNIKCISIPSSVSKISDCAFYHCKNLKIIEIPDESHLQSFSILENDLNDTIIMIPKNVANCFL